MVTIMAKRRKKYTKVMKKINYKRQHFISTFLATEGQITFHTRKKYTMVKEETSYLERQGQREICP